MTDPLEALNGEGTPSVPGSPSPTTAVQAQGPTMGSRFFELVKPTTKTPSMYSEDAWAWGVNTLLGKDSKEAQLGESVALCINVMFPGAGAGAGFPPLLHLGRSVHKFYGLKTEKKKGFFSKKK